MRTIASKRATRYAQFARMVHLLPVTLVQRGQHLLQPLSTELLHPAEGIVGERDSEGLYAAVDLVDAQVGLRQVLYVVGRLVEFRTILLHAALVMQNQHLLLLRLGLLAQRLLLLLRQVHIGLEEETGDRRDSLRSWDIRGYRRVVIYSPASPRICRSPSPRPSSR